MEWQVILTWVLAVPIMLLPAALVWYINIGGICAAIKDARERRTAREKKETEIPEKD